MTKSFAKKVKCIECKKTTIGNVTGVVKKRVNEEAKKIFVLCRICQEKKNAR